MTTTPLVDRTSYAAIVAAEGARIGAVARTNPLEARVPHLRRWRLTDVVAHLGGVHRWAARIAMTRAWDGAGSRKGTERGEALLAWFDEGVEQLVSVLAAADLDAPCPNFSPGSPSTVQFWARRQAHETTVHRWDAESTTGVTGPIDAMVATDGVDELLHVFTRARGGQVLDADLLLRCTDTGGAWLVRPAPKPGRVDVARADPGASTDEAATASATGRAEQLLLALWHRRSPAEADLSLAGRRGAALGFLSGAATP